MSENEIIKKKVTNSNLDIKLWAVGSVLFILMCVFGYLSYLNLHFPLFSRGDFATLGDSFGILSSLFSGLAFAGLIVTIVMQNKTMKAQMEELELARKEYKRQGDELAGQKEVMDAQLQSIKVQQIETTFFKLVDNHRNIVSQMEIDGVSGKKSFFELASKFHELDQNKMHYESYITIYVENEAFLSVYLRSFYNVLNFIDESDLSEEYKLKYAKLFRFEFNDYELSLIIRNCVFYGASDRVIDLVVRYSFFKNLEINTVFSDDFTIYLLCSSFNLKAFGSRKNIVEKNISEVRDILISKSEYGFFDEYFEKYVREINSKKKEFK